MPEIGALGATVVAAPGPLPNAGTEPTCFEVARNGDAAGFSGVDDDEVGEIVSDVDDFEVIAVAAPGPSPKAGTEPTCPEAVRSPFGADGEAFASWFKVAEELKNRGYLPVKVSSGR